MTTLLNPNEEQRIQYYLNNHIIKLAGEIGERNMFQYDVLLNSAEYIKSIAMFSIETTTFEI